MFIAIITVEAKEMNLWCNDKGAEEFASLALEEQYTSYINSFKDIRDVREQPMKWAKRMVKQYGRDVIPLMNETISSSSFDHLLNEPYDSTWTCLCYLFIAFIIGLFLFAKCGISVLHYMFAGGVIAVLYPLLSRICLSS